MSNEQRKHTRRWLWPAIIAILAAGGYAWWHYRAAPAGSSAPQQQAAGERRPGGAGGPGGPGGMMGGPTPVRVVPARSQNMNVTIKSLGTVTALNTATVHTKVDGELKKLLFREGQMVKAGDPLAQIDPATYRVALEQAEGTLEQNKAQLDNARRDLVRYQTLFNQDSIARQQVDTQVALVRQYEGTIKTNQAAVDSARLQLDYTRVTAPISGRLGLRQVDLGNLVHSADANGIVVITQTQPITVVFTLAETDLPAVLKQLRAGNTLPVAAYDRTDQIHIAEGTLTTLDNQIDTTTGTIKLKASFENKDESLFPNQFVNVRLRVDTLADVTVIPAGAVQRGTPGTFVYVAQDDGTVRLQVIKLGPTEGELVMVQDGLKPGDKVVIEGVDRLRDGAKINVVTPEGADGAGGGRNGDNGAGRPSKGGQRRHRQQPAANS